MIKHGMRRWLDVSHDERGSLSAVWVSLVGIVMLLGLVIGEVSYQGYMMRTVRNSASFAAESGAMQIAAGSRLRSTWDRVEVLQWQTYRIRHDYCARRGPDPNWDPDPNNPNDRAPRVCVEWSFYYSYHERTRTATKEAREEELQSSWQDIFQCDDSPNDWEGNTWGCRGKPEVVSPESSNRRVDFNGNAPAMAQDTFRRNWHERRTFHVTNVGASVSDSSRLVTVEVTVRVEPLFLKFLPTRTKTIVGNAQVQVRPFSIQ